MTPPIEPSDKYANLYLQEYLDKANQILGQEGNQYLYVAPGRNPALDKLSGGAIDISKYYLNDQGAVPYLRRGMLNAVAQKYGIDTGPQDQLDTLANRYLFEIPHQHMLSQLRPEEGFGTENWTEYNLLFNPEAFEQKLAGERYDPTGALFSGVKDYEALTRKLMETGALKVGTPVDASGAQVTASDGKMLSNPWAAPNFDNPFTPEVEKLGTNPGTYTLFADPNSPWASAIGSAPISIKNPSAVASDFDTGFQGGERQETYYGALSPYLRDAWTKLSEGAFNLGDGGLSVDLGLNLGGYSAAPKPWETDPNWSQYNLGYGWREEDDGMGLLGNVAALGLLAIPGFQALAPALQGALIGGVGGTLSSGDLEGGLKGAALGGIGGGIADWAGLAGNTAALPADQIGALTQGGDMSWFDDLMNFSGNNIPLDTSVNTWGALAQGLSPTAPTLTALNLSDLANQDFLDFGITGVESLGDALNYSTGAADTTYGISLQTKLADMLREAGLGTNEALSMASKLIPSSGASVLKTGKTALDLLKPATGSTATKIGSGLSNLLGLSSGAGNTLGAIFGGLAAYDAIQANKRAATNAQNLMAQQRSPHYTAGLEAAQWAVPRGRSIASTRTPSRFAEGGYLKGGTAGQDDLIPALLSDGEYVIDAETVSMLGDGNNEAGADRLDRMRMKIRGHKRGAPDDEIAPRAKEVHEYLGKGA